MIPIPRMFRQLSVSERTFYRREKEYTRVEMGQALEMEPVHEEHARMKWIVYGLTPDKAMLKDVLLEKF